MDILDRILGPDIGTTMRFVIAFAVVFALVLAAAWLLKRLSSGFSTTEKRGRAPRLAVLEAVAVDQRRRLLLVRRDNMEHLLLIGGPSDIVVEQAIQRIPRQAMQRPSDTAAEVAPKVAAPVAASPAPTPVARPEPRLDPSPVPQPRPDPRPVKRAVPRMAQPAAKSPDDQDDGAQRQLAEMAERLEMALRAPGTIHPAPVAPAAAPAEPAAAKPAAAPELRTTSGDRIGRTAEPPAADNDVVEADIAVGQEGRKSGSLFGRLSRRSSE